MRYFSRYRGNFIRPYDHAEIGGAVNEFYCIMAIDAILVKDGNLEPFKHSHDRWYSDYVEYRQMYIDKLESAIFDYTVTVVGGELRHGYQRAEYYSPAISQDTSRSYVYNNEVILYDPDSLLRLAVANFEEGEWAPGYGGAAWGAIARAGLMRKQLGKIGFIDHCVDLSHNNSIYFDKEDSMIFWLQSSGRYKRFLDKKRRDEPEELLATTGMSQRLCSLVCRGMVLGILPEMELLVGVSAPNLVEIDESVKFILGRDPIEWGSTIISSKLKESVGGNYHSRYIAEDYDEDDEDDEEDDYYDYYEEDDDNIINWPFEEVS